MQPANALRVSFAWAAVALCAPSAARAQEPEISIVLTADTEGHLLSCGGCPDRAGGLARRATLLATLRKEGPLLLVDAGNALFGPESPGGEATAAYRSLGYDALNLSHRDLLAGKDRVLKLAAPAALPFVSANVLDAERKELVVQPFVVAKLGAKRIAFLGLTEAPPGLGTLAEVDRALAGFRVEDPELALTAWLPKAAEASDAVVLLWYGSARGVMRLAQSHGGQLAAILVGGARPQYLPQGGKPPVFGAEALGRALTKITLAGADARSASLAVTPALPEDTELARTLAQALQPGAAKPKPAAPSAAADAAPTAAAGDELEPERTLFVATSGANRAIRLTVRSVWTGARYGSVAAPEGRRFVVLDTEWENLRGAGDKDGTGEYRLADVAAALELVPDGNGVTPARLPAAAAAWPGHLPLTDLRLPAIGSRLRGNAVFELPAARVTSLELRLTDATCGAIRLPILRGGRAQALPGVAADPTQAPPPETGKPPEAAPTAKEPDARPVAKPPLPQPEIPQPAVGKPEAPDARKPAAQPPKLVPKGLAGAGLTADQVNAAIDRGADSLWKYLREKELTRISPLGSSESHSLASLALVHAGAHRRFPDFNAALREYLRTVQPPIGMYHAGVLAMLVEAYGEPEFLPRLREVARFLIEAQGPGGSWNYTAPISSELCRDVDARVLQVTGGAALDGSPTVRTDWERTTPWDKTTDGDNSVSQFALLGLRAAARCDVPVSKETWRRARASFLKRQLADGGWSYESGGPSYGSMSCAGVCALAVTTFELGTHDAPLDPALERGLAWLEKNFSVTDNPVSGQYRYYYLYSLERTGRILETEFFGPHEWYPLGAKQLLDTQLPDGHWESVAGGESEALATSFALLFLTRATATLKTELKHGGPGRLKTAVQLPPQTRLYVILDASGSMLEQVEGREKFQIAREALARMLEVLPQGTEVGLRVYGHRKRALEEGADEDTALELPLQPFDKEAFFAKLATLRARGRTPLARSLTEALNDLRSGAGGRPTTVLLLTDGGEDTRPRQDPLLAAEKLGALPGVTLHVVGFDINRDDWSQELRGMAARSRGHYWPAQGAKNLGEELQAAVLRMPEGFSVAGAGAKEIARGRFGETLELPEGRYTVTTSFAGQKFEASLWINTDATTSVVFDGSKIRQQQGDPKAGMFCSKCGQPLQPDARFCGSCGTKTGR